MTKGISYYGKKLSRRLHALRQIRQEKRYSRVEVECHRMAGSAQSLLY
jgi:hypothetical protein